MNLTTSEYIEKPANDFCAEHGVSQVQFDQGKINEFVSFMDDNYEQMDEGSFNIDYLDYAWKWTTNRRDNQ